MDELDGDRLEHVAERVFKGEVVTASVRELIGWLGYSRRGTWVVAIIQNHLANLGLATKPDFAAAYIDSRIQFVKALATTDDIGSSGEGRPSSQESTAHWQGESRSQPTATVDPTMRISRLRAANTKPISIQPEAPIEHAITLMMSHDFSQLPVMTTERNVIGMVSWKSIGSRLALGEPCSCVRDCLEPHAEVLASASFFDVIDLIVHQQAVLVRDSAEKIVGIVTASDFSLEFRKLAEPFLLLGEIENHLRNLIEPRFSVEDLRTAKNPSDTGRIVNAVSDLTFGEYINLLSAPNNWNRLRLKMHRATFVNDLESIRKIRNDVTHFDPDPMSPDDLRTLRRITRFLGEVAGIQARRSKLASSTTSSSSSGA